MSFTVISIESPSLAWQYCRARSVAKKCSLRIWGGRGLTSLIRSISIGLVTAFLPISWFSSRLAPPGVPTHVIYGGVGREFLESEPLKSGKSGALFAGRLLPHKGINYLIEGIRREVSLTVIGRPYHNEYYKLLQQLAEGKNVRFITTASDMDLAEAYRSAVVTLLPSVYRDVYGGEYAMPELLGLVILESMACGTPVICTDVGGMPEFVEDGVTGFVVPPNDPIALRDRIDYLIAHPEVAVEMGRRGRQNVLERFTWPAVAQRCLEAYSG